jgi:hypothetical protein
MTHAAMEPVLVTWWDAAGNDERRSPDTPGDLDAMGPILVRSAGFLVTQDDQRVVIVQDYWDFPEKRIWRNWLTVPRGCVVEVQSLVPATSAVRPPIILAKDAG